VNALVFAVVVAALGLLFAAGLRMPVGRPGWPRWAGRALLVLGAVAATVLANVALYRHDLHFDLTSSRAFSPSPELARLARELEQDVELTYFFQKQDPAAQAIKALLPTATGSAPTTWRSSRPAGAASRCRPPATRTSPSASCG